MFAHFLMSFPALVVAATSINHQLRKTLLYRKGGDSNWKTVDPILQRASSNGGVYLELPISSELANLVEGDKFEMMMSRFKYQNYLYSDDTKTYEELLKVAVENFEDLVIATVRENRCIAMKMDETIYEYKLENTEIIKSSVDADANARCAVLRAMEDSGLGAIQAITTEGFSVLWDGQDDDDVPSEVFNGSASLPLSNSNYELRNTGNTMKVGPYPELDFIATAPVVYRLDLSSPVIARRPSSRTPFSFYHGICKSDESILTIPFDFDYESQSAVIDKLLTSTLGSFVARAQGSTDLFQFYKYNDEIKRTRFGRGLSSLPVLCQSDYKGVPIAERQVLRVSNVVLTAEKAFFLLDHEVISTKKLQLSTSFPAPYIGILNARVNVMENWNANITSEAEGNRITYNSGSISVFAPRVTSVFVNKTEYPVTNVKYGPNTSYLVYENVPLGLGVQTVLLTNFSKNDLYVLVPDPAYTYKNYFDAISLVMTDLYQVPVDISEIWTRPDLYSAIFDLPENTEKCFVAYSLVSQPNLSKFEVTGFAKCPILIRLYTAPMGLLAFPSATLRTYQELNFKGLWTNDLSDSGSGKYDSPDPFKFGPDQIFSTFNNRQLSKTLTSIVSYGVQYGSFIQNYGGTFSNGSWLTQSNVSDNLIYGVNAGIQNYGGILTACKVASSFNDLYEFPFDVNFSINTLSLFFTQIYPGLTTFFARYNGDIYRYTYQGMFIFMQVVDIAFEAGPFTGIVLCSKGSSPYQTSGFVTVP